jgi:hypothetical protein
MSYEKLQFFCAKPAITAGLWPQISGDGWTYHCQFMASTGSDNTNHCRLKQWTGSDSPPIIVEAINQRWCTYHYRLHHNRHWWSDSDCVLWCTALSFSFLLVVANSCISTITVEFLWSVGFKSKGHSFSMNIFNISDSFFILIYT